MTPCSASRRCSLWKYNIDIADHSCSIALQQMSLHEKGMLNRTKCAQG